MGYTAGLRQTRVDAAREAARVAEYATFGGRAGVRLAEHEIYQGDETARTDAAVRMIALQNVLGADERPRAAYAAAFAEAYQARFAAQVAS